MIHARRPNPVSDCPLTAALAAVGGKWKAIIVYHLAQSPKHFAAIRQRMPDISQKVLAEQLGELIADDIVARTRTGAMPAPVRYSLTEHGRSTDPLPCWRRRQRFQRQNCAKIWSHERVTRKTAFLQRGFALRKNVMVKYKVKQDRAAENQRYIEAVFKELKATAPAGLHYASFKLDDGVTFVHVASIDSDSGENPLFQSAAFTSFLADIEDRCEDQPVTQPLHEVGSYAFHAESYR